MTDSEIRLRLLVHELVEMINRSGASGLLGVNIIVQSNKVEQELNKLPTPIPDTYNSGIVDH